ncbi:permease prefix domain 1-containing protein [Enterococcus sp. LJL98]
MKVIKDYIEVLFLQVPVTIETIQIKEDLLASAEDHYFGLVEDGKSEKEAIGIVISEFGTIDEILNALDLEKATAENDLAEDDFSLEQEALSIDEAYHYWHEVRRFSLGIATGFFFFIGAFGFIPLMDGFFYNGFIAGMSLIIMFLFWALGFLFVAINGYHLRKNIRSIKKRTIPSIVREEAFKQAESYRRSYLAGISASVITYMLAFPLAISLSNFLPYYEIDLLVFVGFFAMGTFLLLYVFIIQKEYRRMIQLNQRAQKKQRKAFLRQQRKRMASDQDLFWVIVTLVYFIFSFLFHSWLYSWLIFLVGYVVQSLLINQTKEGRYN